MIHFENVTVTSDIGNIDMPLVTGTFDLDIKEKGWSTIGKLPSEMLVAGCLLTIDGVVFNTPTGKPTQIEIQGAIKLNPDIADVSIVVGGSHKIVIAPSGVSLTGGEMTFPDKEFKLLNLVNVKSSGVSVEYKAAEPDKKPKPLPDRLLIRGKFEFPDWWESVADLSKNTVDPSKDNYIEVSANGADVKGSFAFNKINWGLWQIKELKLSVDTKQRILQGDLTLKTPLSSVAIVGGAGFIQGEFNYIALGVDDLNIMIGTSPVFLQKIVGNVNHISDKDKDPISIGGQLGFTAGPELNIPFPEQLGGPKEGSLAKLELEGEINVKQAKGYGKLTTIGDLLTGEVVAAIDYSKVTSDPNASWGSILVTAKGEMKALWDLFSGQVSLTMDCRTATRLAASGNGKVAIPKYIPLWGGAEIASGEMLAKYNDDNNYKNDYLAAWGSVVVRKFGKAYKFTAGAKIDFEGNTTWLGARGAAETKLSYSDFEQSILNPPAATTSSELTGPPPIEYTPLAHNVSINDRPDSMFEVLGSDDESAAASAFDIGPDSPWALLSAQWEDDVDDAEVILIAPDGTVYYETDIQNDPDMILLDQDYVDTTPDSNLMLLPDNTKSILVINPMAGEWKIRVDSDSGTITTPVYNGMFNTPAPEITITDVQSDGRKVNIDYAAADLDNNASISFYYDSDDEGIDGVLIVAGLNPQGIDSYTWKPDEVLAGDYYIYAVAEDEDNPPVVTYYANPVPVEEFPPGEEIPLGDGLAKSVMFTDADGSQVTVKLAKGQGILTVIGENIDTIESKKGIEITGEQLTLAEVNLSSSTPYTSLTVITKGGDIEGTTIGNITGDSLGKLTGKQLDVIDDITLTGIFGSMAIDDIGQNVTIAAKPSTRGFTLKADEIAQNVEFDLTGMVKSFQAAAYDSGTIRADQIGQIKIKAGEFGADVQAVTGDIGGISTVGDITGRISAETFIKKITAKSGSLIGGVVRAGTELVSLTALNLDHAIISAGDDIKKINLKGDILDSYILGGYDIGTDCVFGGGDSLTGGNVLSVTAKGIFARSYIAAGTLPNSPLTNFLPNVGEDSNQGGTINKMKITEIDYLNNGNQFGLYAATEIKPFKIGKNLAQNQGDFVIR